MYRDAQTKLLVGEIAPDEWVTNPRGIKTIKLAKWRLALDVTLNERNLQSHIDAVRRLSPGPNQMDQFIPVQFLCTNKITKDDRLSLAFHVAVLSEHLGLPVVQGEIIHGDCQFTVRVRTAGLLKEISKVTGRIHRLLSEDSPPELILNRHCVECEFQAPCYRKAIEKDDLSLLPGISEKERKNLNSRGIFTVTHLSYTFRPRRKSRRCRDKREKYHNSLKALAIREQKVHVVGSDELVIGGTPVYLDLEAIPDRGFYYLIGLRIVIDQMPVQHSLWADNKDDEERNWGKFIEILSEVDNPIIIHYGSFEATFLKQMCERYGSPEKESVAARAIDATINLLSFIFARIYFPTYSNGLKDVGRYLGFSWSDANPSGIKTLLWRSEWEKSRTLSVKQKLVVYNAEDCEALHGTTEFVKTISVPGNRSAGNQGQIVQADSLPRKSWFKWGKTEYLLPALNEIGRAAYWDYQREKIILRSNKSLRRFARTPAPNNEWTPEVNTVIQWPAPDACIHCGRSKLYRHWKYSKVVIDVKFGRSGIKRWITQYISYYYRCPTCHAVFCGNDRPWNREKYGRNLVLLCAYLNIDLRIPQKRIAVFLKEVLGFRFSNNVVNKFKEKAALLYRPTYECLLNKIVNGALIHADETPVNVDGKTGYIWVLASMEDVAYLYTPSREGNLIQTLLRNFKGVLVTDFYAAYESIACPQQKCLLHLIRDLNDDLMKEPYNAELKRLVAEFADLLKPMVETVDRFGLKTRFLRRHKKDAERFFKNLSQRVYHTEITVKCKNRFEKNRSTLFTFLDYDDVPWNNNNAEHAIKTAVLLRRNLGGLSTERAIGDYLTLLSVCETCRFKGISFLDFLRSSEDDIDAYVRDRTRRGRKCLISFDSGDLDNQTT